jgi:hypothetical protein
MHGGITVSLKGAMRETRASWMILLVFVGWGFAPAACGSATPSGLGDGGPGDGNAGAGGNDGGITCGTNTCAPGGKCCFACISLCAAPGESCPVFIQDPCAQHAAATGPPASWSFGSPPARP